MKLFKKKLAIQFRKKNKHMATPFQQTLRELLNIIISIFLQKVIKLDLNYTMKMQV